MMRKPSRFPDAIREHCRIIRHEDCPVSALVGKLRTSELRADVIDELVEPGRDPEGSDDIHHEGPYYLPEIWMVLDLPGGGILSLRAEMRMKHGFPTRSPSHASTLTDRGLALLGRLYDGKKG